MLGGRESGIKAVKKKKNILKRGKSQESLQTTFCLNRARSEQSSRVPMSHPWGLHVRMEDDKVRKGNPDRRGCPKGLSGQDRPNQGNQCLVLPLTAAGSGKTTSLCCLSSGQDQGDGDLSRHHTLPGNPAGLAQGLWETL